MRILYDDQGFYGHHSGVARYFTEVMKRLPRGVTYELPLVSTSSIYLQQAPFNLPPHKYSLDDFIRRVFKGHLFPGISRLYRFCAQLMPQRFPSGELANIKSVRAAIKEGRFDVFHLTGAHLVRDDWKMIVGKKPIVVTVHDLIPDLLCRDKRVALCRQKVISAASQIIAVSEYTKRDLMRTYGVPDEKITVIHHGYISPLENGRQENKEYKLPYLLYVGKRDGYKNFNWFLKVVAPVLKAHDGLRLFCTGLPFSKSEVSLIKELGVEGLVSQGFVEDSQMPQMFSDAVAFVYPSLYEGFGIPILDAFAAGCPVLLSNASCFPEVGGDAALYFDPHDENDLREKLAMILGTASATTEFRRGLISKGKERLKDFSWEKCVDETVRVYRKALDTHS